MKKQNKKTWHRLRHEVVRNIASLILTPYSRIKYGIKVDKFREQGKRNYLVLYNHQTAFDQFFVGMAFRGHIYYVASEDIFSKGWVSKLIKYLVAPIPIKKQSTDVRAVIDCMRVAKEGRTIAIAPEGNRTFSGKTGYMNPAIAMLAKKLGLPLAFYRLEGGYGVHPRWSDKVRKGKMRGYISRVIEPSEYEALSNEELLSVIEKELYVNEGCADAIFKSKHGAEYLERAFYVCPECGLSRFESKGDRLTCCRCGKAVKYLPTKDFVGDGFEFPFKHTTDWYDYQCDFVRGLDLSAYTDSPMYEETATLFEIIPYKSRTVLKKAAKVKLFGDRITVSDNEETCFPFNEISGLAVLGKNKLNIYRGKEIFQIKGGVRFNALKFVNIFYHHKNVERGDGNYEFLGL